MIRKTKPILRMTALMLSLCLLAGCGGNSRETLPSETEPTETTPEPVVYEPVVTGNGNPSSLSYAGSYLSEEGADAVAARVGEEELTNRMLRFFYNLEIGSYRNSGETVQPDYDLPLFSQSCPMTKGLSWEHYFLEKALNSWHSCQALVIESRQPQIISETNYKAEPTTHEQFFPDTLPAYPLAYIDKECYLPNSMHQAFLDGIPEQVQELADRLGFADADALARALSGEDAEAKDLEDYVNLYNYAYFYFTELSYSVTVTDREADIWRVNHPEDYEDTEKTVTILHSLMRPAGAEVDDSGRVTASEEEWAACLDNINKLLASRKKDWITTHNPENTFAVLANQNSADGGTRASGGRYVSIRRGQMNPQIEEWAFADERKYGDVETIRTDMGYEVLFFKSSEEIGFAQAKEDCLREKFRARLEELKRTYPMEVDYSKICLTEAAPTAAMEDILYPDVAHEHYPEMMVYLQQDYAPAPFGAWQVSRHGCGITTMAMVTTYLSDTTYTPAVLADEYSMFATPNGTDGTIFQKIPPELGFFCDKTAWDWETVEEALNSGKIVVSLQYHGHFTKTGHYLALVGLTEEGDVVIRDSNIYNYGRLAGHKVDHFDPQLVIANNAVYWIFQPKIRRIEACSRCGDPDNCGMPEGLLLEDYTCEKCLTALSRRNAFLALTAE